MVSREFTASTYPAKKGSACVAQVDSSSDGNAGVVSPRQPPLISSPLPQPPTPLAGQGRLLEEKNDRISKEKQKFFRLSAFNAEHSKLKRVGGGDKSRPSRNVSARSTRGTADPKKLGMSRVSSSSSAGEGSSSSEADNSSESSEGSDSSDEDDEDDDDDDDEDDDEEGNSSSESSGDTCSSSDEAQHDRIESPKTKVPFACDLSEDKPWGFAAAAAKLNVESPFFSNITNTFGAPLPKLDVGDTPTFGLHIQPAAVNASDSKKKQLKCNTAVQSPGATFVGADNKVKPGSGQLRSLFDGLSHFFSAPSRARSAGVPAPNYAPDRRKRPNAEDTEAKTSRVSSRTGNNQRNKPDDSPSKSKERKKTEVVDTMSRVPKPGIFVPSDESLYSSLNEKLPKMTPSNLVKTAVNSKRHEHERRKLMKDDVSSLIKCAAVAAPSSPSSSSSRHEQQQSRKKHTAADTSQIRHPVPASVAKSGLSSDSVKSNSNPKSNPRTYTSATTTNTTTTPRATPCSTRKGKSLPHPFTVLTSMMHPKSQRRFPSNLILAHNHVDVLAVWCVV